jgi:hypothetical protein
LTLLGIDIPFLDALHNYGKIKNIIKMWPLPFLGAQFLTYPYNLIGLGLDFLHASTPN